jgi:ubiquitin-conjugating enzyme E2 J2
MLIVPDEFPHKPPRLIFLTPNGLFIPGHKVCISVGEFHTNDGPGRDGAYGWRPALGMSGFAAQVVNALICSDTLGSGIGIAHSSPAEKQKLAESSRAYNAAHYPNIVADLEVYVLANPRAEPVVNLLAGRGEPPAPAAPAAPAAPTTPTTPAAPAAPPASAAPAAPDEIDALLQELEKTKM